ncbi:M56 family metallopeptidase [Flammeovirga aprica]|uniref:M56 family metallopeptidase n=1 Tax=Flammeovirga aprica JL-4 TaxID=694437 RepID=A0A7X9P1F1_9BACT|nr:M56 family metallopeptidase [Flammeovirga aprica]NME67468.1 M56 family metallopeptidase [Flammeovirga aprica JL-4]
MISYLLLSSTGLLVLALFYFVFHKNETFFQQNRFTILVGVIVSLVFPLFENILSYQQQSFISESLPVIYLPEIIVGNQSIEEQSIQWSWSNFILLIYSIVLIVLAIRFCISNFKLIRFIRFHKKINFRGSTLIYTEGKYPTFAYLKYIFWDNTTSLTEHEQELIFQHERTHIKEFHSIDIFLMEILKIIFWFHPAIYLIDAALRTQHEYLADQKANQTTNDASYSQLMIRSLFEDVSLNVGHGFQFSTVKSRIKMLKKERTNQWKRVSSLFTFSILVTSIVFLQACVKDEFDIKDADSQLAEVTSEQVFGYQIDGRTYWDVQNTFSEEIRSNPDDLKFINVLKGEKVPSYFNNSVKGVLVLSFKDDLNTELIGKLKNLPSTSLVFDINENKEMLAKQDEKSDRVFEEVQNPANFPGGMNNLYKIIGEEMKYPQEAKEKGIEGKVYLEFVIDEKGNGQDFKVLNDVDPLLSEEALRVAPIVMKGWNPANHNGTIVKQRLVMPISFKL